MVATSNNTKCLTHTHQNIILPHTAKINGHSEGCLFNVRFPAAHDRYPGFANWILVLHDMAIRKRGSFLHSPGYVRVIFALKEYYVEYW